MENPYQSGEFAAHAPSSGVVTPGVLQALAATKPWVQFCSVIGFLCSGFMIVLGLLMMVGAAAGSMSGRGAAMPFAGFQIVMGIMYIVLSLLYLVPSIKLLKYGSSINRLLSGNSVADLENAMEQQRGFWKFVGIMLIVGIVMMLVSIVGMMMFGFAAAASVR